VSAPSRLAVVAVVMVALVCAALARALPPGRRALAAAPLAWLALAGAVAASGAFAGDGGKPQLVGAFAITATVSGLVVVLRTELGRALARALPLWAPIAAQSFRVPVELALAQAHEERLVNVARTFHGWNYDVVTGASAPIVAIAVWRFGARARGLAIAHALVGIALLVVIVGTAVALLPGGPMAAEQRNVLVLSFPGVWLAAFLAPLAGVIHALSLRQLAGREAA